MPVVEPAVGTEFPVRNGRRSSTALGKEVFASCVAELDPDLAAEISSIGDWRSDYLAPCRDAVALAAESGANAQQIATNGLRTLHESFVFGSGGEERPLDEAVADPDAVGFADVVVRGQREFRAPAVVLPYRGTQLVDTGLRAQLATWVRNGTVEPSFETAMATMADNPQWLDLRGVNVVLFGAGAELGPVQKLLQWGADVWAVDLPRPEVWRRLIEAARNSPGNLHVPIPPHVAVPNPEDVNGLAEIAGANLITQTPQVRRWLDNISGEVILGNYGYADGALHVRLSMACDAIVADYSAEHPDAMLAFLATPTDAFAVSATALEMSRERWRANKVARFTRRPLSVFRLFQPNYRTTVVNDSGVEVGIADCIVPQQGPNYLLAKRLQRFRAVVARKNGQRVSLNVAPATRTQSVLKNKALAAAYAGAGRFGIEVFDPDTCNTAMATLLVRDFRDPASLTNPANDTANPMDLFIDGANHGGLWTTPYDPRSVLGIAAVVGMFERSA